jgi:acetyl-CoA acetyltransferase family protein
MKLGSACIPLGHAWTSPFARWQGALSEISSLDLAVLVTRRALDDRDVPADALSSVVMGWTVPQEGIFYGAPTLAARIGAPGITGPMISQACATSVACVQTAAAQVEEGGDEVVLVVATDRTSNGPHLVYPRPSAPGAQPLAEDWVMDNFRRDPWAGKAMIDTAEAVAAEGQVTRDEIDEVTLQRYEQYEQSLADDRAFQRRYMVPVEIPQRRGNPVVVEADEGVFPTTAEGLAKLAPVNPDGVVTYGSQTHPADGAAGMLVTSADRARELSRDQGIARLLATGFARVEKARMPKAPVPAAQAALDAAGLSIADVDAVTSHNPFAVNDIWFSRETGFPLDRMNVYGSSLVYGHPQGPTGARLLSELIETLRERGGGTGLFTGCAAGDTGGAVVVRVEE